MAIPVERTTIGCPTAWPRTVLGEGVRRARDCRKRQCTGISNRFGRRYGRLTGGHQNHVVRSRSGHGQRTQIGQCSACVGSAGAARQSHLVHTTVFLSVRNSRV